MPLKLIGSATYRGGDGDIPVICPVKNEIGLLPHFIAHHRGLGVENFIFIDNDSNDGTTEYLLSQPGCVVYHTADSYAESKFAAEWVNAVLRENAVGQWAVYLDCDELLVYEDMERTPLIDFLRRYDRDGVDSFFAVMIDMYPEGDWKGVAARNLPSLRQVLNCFDSEYVIRSRPRRPGISLRPDSIEVLGGPRCRLFSTVDRDAARGWSYYTIAGQVDRFVDRVPLRLMPLLARIWPRGAQALFKTPLNRIGPDFRYEYSHESSNRAKARSMLGILHLKFCDELNARFDPQFSYDNHYRHGLERFQLAAALQRLGDASLCYPGTRRFTSSEDLLRLGIIGERPAIWHSGAERFRTGEAAG